MYATLVYVDRIGVDDPLGAIAAHGMGGIWGTLSCGLFTTPALAAVGEPGLFYGGGLYQLGIQALGIVAAGGFVFLASLAVFATLKATIGIRVKPEQELDGLDIHEHGVFGYPDLVATDYQNGNGSRQIPDPVEGTSLSKAHSTPAGSPPAGVFLRQPEKSPTPSCMLCDETREQHGGQLGRTPITQATGHNNTIVAVYEDRIDIKTGWQSQNVESVSLRDVALIGIKGLVNVTLTIETNTGRVYQLNRMALPDARRIKNTFEQQKQKGRPLRVEHFSTLQPSASACQHARASGPRLSARRLRLRLGRLVRKSSQSLATSVDPYRRGQRFFCTPPSVARTEKLKAEAKPERC